MSGDLEDFLRRAAQRRQAKAAQQQQQQPTPRQRPQYSNRQTERRVRSEQPEEVLTAEIVEEDPNSYSARTKRVEEAKRAAKKAEAEVAEALRKAGGAKASKASSVTVALTGQPTLDLLAMLRQPVGIQQAILLREILDRPEHRW